MKKTILKRIMAVLFLLALTMLGLGGSMVFFVTEHDILSAITIGFYLIVAFGCGREIEEMLK